MQKGTFESWEKVSTERLDHICNHPETPGHRNLQTRLTFIFGFK